MQSINQQTQPDGHSINGSTNLLVTQSTNQQQQPQSFNLQSEPPLVIQFINQQQPPRSINLLINNPPPSSINNNHPPGHSMLRLPLYQRDLVLGSWGR